MTSIGLLGGTFDPIHVGHLDVARAARELLELSRVFVLPSKSPPHRSEPHASAAHRFAMAALATQADEHLVVSDLELQADGPSFTWATLDRLAASGIRVEDLVFITGADAFREIETWLHYPALLDRCHFAVVSRPGYPAGALRQHLPSLAARMVDAPCRISDRPSIFLVERPTAPVSSTEIRRRVAAGDSIRDLVPSPVSAYIAKHGLYGPQGVA